MSSTIVDLAVRKYLVIEEIPKTWMLGKADWNLRRLPDPEGDHLLPYEEKLRDGLFEDARTRPQVPSSSVTRTPFTVTRRAIF